MFEFMYRYNRYKAVRTVADEGSMCSPSVDGQHNNARTLREIRYVIA